MGFDLRRDFSAWCREQGEERLSIQDVFEAPPEDGGRILRPVWEQGVVLQHPAAMGRDEAWRVAEAWTDSLRKAEAAPKTLVLLSTPVEQLAPSEIAERSAHAIAFGQAWLDRIDATHDIRLVARLPSDGVLSVQTASTSEPAELHLDEAEVAHVLQRIYGQRHPDRAASIRFCPAQTDDDPDDEDFEDDEDDEDDKDDGALELPMYLLGFAKPWKPGAPRGGNEAFDHAYAFACQWCATVDCEHNLLVNEFGSSDDVPKIYVFRDDVTAELNFDEEEPAAAIARRYEQRHPERKATFIGEYIK